MREVPVHNLDFDDPIFDSLKDEYPAIKEWWAKISREGRKAWVFYKKERDLGAILIYKTENEAVPNLNPILPANPRVKICTFKVTSMGYKIGELFLKMSFDFAIKNNVSEIYLTHFTKEQDDLVDLITEFGFSPVGKNNGEDLYLKKMIPDNNIKSAFEIDQKFYPSFYDGPRVRKFIVPIWPEYHEKLFTNYPSRQSSISEWAGEFIIEGNTIKKAYLSHSKIRKISPGDILLFYRSRDWQILTSLGVIETIYHDLRNPDQIMRYVGKRTVYSKEEIEEFAKQPTTVIIFRWHFHLKRPIHQTDLLHHKIISQMPQSITEIPHKSYLLIKDLGQLNKHFTITF